MESNDLFKLPIRSDGLVDMSYKQHISNYVQLLEAQEKMADHCFCMLDYVEGNFVYIPHQNRFLCGNKFEEVKKSGIRFFEKILPKEDLDAALCIKQRFWTFFNQINPQDWINYWVRYDLHVKIHAGWTRLLNFKFKPFFVDQKGNLILGLMMLGLSNQKKTGNLQIYSIKDRKMFVYSEKRKMFIHNRISYLSAIENDILTLLAQGYTLKEIAVELSIEEYSVKFYSKNIKYKLRVKKSTEAVYLFTQMGEDFFIV